MKKLLMTLSLAAFAASCTNTTSTSSDCEKACESAAVCEASCDTACASACSADSVTFSVYKYKDRLYVISKPETIASFKATGHMAFTKTYIGAGPNKETVVVEVCKDDNEFAEKLWKAFNQK